MSAQCPLAVFRPNLAEKLNLPRLAVAAFSFFSARPILVDVVDAICDVDPPDADFGQATYCATARASMTAQFGADCCAAVLDLGFTTGGRIIWAAFANTNRYEGMLSGRYVGATAEASIGGSRRQRSRRWIERVGGPAAAVNPGTDGFRRRGRCG
jgi:hypothetical protein